MSRSKLTLPFSQACKLTEPQKCKLIECQGHRIALEEWEIKALLEVCCANGWVDKGLAVLYEYAGHMDGFKKVVEERSNCMEDTIDFVLGLSQQHGMLNIAELQSVALSSASLLINSIHILSLWRRLQCCPRPLFVEERQGGKWSFPFLLRDEAKRFSDALFQSVAHVNLLEVLGVEIMAVLVAPYMDYENFVDLVKYQQKYATGGRQRNHRRQASDPVDRSDASLLLRADSPVRLAFQAVREVLELEDRIGRTWEALGALQQLQQQQQQQLLVGNRAEPSQLYPVLRLPYRSFKPPTEDLAWFQAAVPRYLEADRLLAAFAKTQLLLLGTPEQTFQGPGGALGPMKGTYAAADASKEESETEEFVGDSAHQGAVNATPAASTPLRVAVAGGPPGAAAGPGGFVRGARSAAAPFLASPSLSARTPVLVAGGGSGVRRSERSTPQKQIVLQRTRGQDESTPFSPASGPQHFFPQSPLQHPFLQGVPALPSRGNNAEPEDHQHSEVPGEESWIGFGASAAASPISTGRQPSGLLDPNLRKRSVTVAVVEHPEGVSPMGKDLSDVRRRVTHAGTMSASSSVHSMGAALAAELGEQTQQQASATPATSSHTIAINSPQTRQQKYLLLQSRGVFSDSVAPLPEEGSAAAVTVPIGATLSHSAIVVDAPLPESQVPLSARNAPTREIQHAVSSDDGIQSDANSSREASRRSSPVPQPILKQASSRSDSGPARLPSQIVRAASDIRTKTLSFDTLPEDGAAATGTSSSSSLQGGVTPSTPLDRPRFGSFEILYQETPEDRPAQPLAVFQATPSPLVARKRAQSTPLHLITMNAPHSASSTAPPSSSGSTSIPFSPALHVSTSMDALNFLNTDTTSQRNRAAEARLHSAPGHSERKTYRGKHDSNRPSSQSPSRRQLHRSATRNFSARRREGEDGEPHFMETFGMLDTLSRPFTRGESMAESQVLQIALRSMRVEGSTLLQLAARKISVWWKLVAPRKKLLRRMARRDECREIVMAMADSAVAAGIMRQRRRRDLLRSGAAMKIQRMFRFWCSTILVESRRLEQEQRGIVAWRKLGLVVRVVQVAIRIYRFLRYWQRRRKVTQRTNKFNPGLMLQRTIDKYMQLRTLRKKLEQQQQLYTKLKVASMLSTPSARNTLYRERELAVACIQRGYRAYMLYKRQLERQYCNIMCSKITYFFIRCIARRRVKQNKKWNAAAVKIQTFFRGLHTRVRILKIVKSGLLLNAMWRKHKAYVSLKSQLRRVDRPHTLVIHGIRNIAKKTINSNQMRFKISVWWHPLLHIVSQNDFNTIVQTKQPQFIYNSDPFYMVDIGEPRANRRMSISQGLRKLSSLIVPMARRQSTLPSARPSQSKPSSGVFRYSQVLVDRSSTATHSARASILSMYNAVTSRKGSSMPLPPIAGAGTRTAASSISGPPPSRSSVLLPSVGAGANLTTTAPSNAGTASIGMRKESVEVMRPSALLAAGLDIIHSDDEPSDSDEDEDDDGDDEKSPKGDGSDVQVKGRTAVSRSFIQSRMGLPSPGSGRSQHSVASNSSNAMGSDSSVSLALAGLSRIDCGQSAAEGSGPTSLQEGDLQQDTAVPEEESTKRWRRLSNVVLNDLNMLAEANGEESAGVEVGALPRVSSDKKPNVSNILMRSSLNLMSLGARAASKKASLVPETDPKMICHFEDVVVKIPGCHGNSVIKFEIFEGDRKYGNTLFYLSKEGEMMFWGGEYQRNVTLLQQRRAVQFNSHIINARNPNKSSGGAEAGQAQAGAKAGAGGGKRVGSVLSSNFINNEEPILDFRVISGAALRSKCSWGRVAVRGSGPLKRILKSRDFLSSFLFDKWHRFFFSLDEAGLHLYDNKFDNEALHVIPVADLKEVSVDVGAPIKQSTADAAKNVSEDIHNVKVVTFSGDDLYMRFPDTGTRVAWQEALTNTIVQHKFSGNSLAGSRRAWVNTAIEGESAHKGRGVLASAQSDDPSSEEGSKANTPTARNGGGGFGSFADGSGTSHLHRLLRLRTERAMASITGGPTTSDPRGSGQRASSSPTAEARAGRPVKPEVKVIINAQRGSSGSPSQPSGSGNDSGKQSSARGVKYKY